MKVYRMKLAKIKWLICKIVFVILFFNNNFILAQNFNDKLFQIEPQDNELKVMTYNVSNLFDWEHDEGKEDWTFLPLSHPLKSQCTTIKNEIYRKQCENTDWTESAFKAQIDQIKKAIDLQGSTPDILAVQEIENGNVAQTLASKLGFSKFIITKGLDKRGIEVALFYNEKKLSIIETEEIDVSQVLGFQSRKILRVHFKWLQDEDGKVLSVYVNHWPAKMFTPYLKIKVAEELKKSIDTQISLIGRSLLKILVLGDFNTEAEETPNPVTSVLLNPNWNEYLLDTQNFAVERKSPNRYLYPNGSYFGGGDDLHWKPLDKILFSRNLIKTDSSHIVPESFRILAHSELLRELRIFKKEVNLNFYNKVQNVPKRFNTSNPLKIDPGYSDHLPIYVLIRAPKTENVSSQK